MGLKYEAVLFSFQSVLYKFSVQFLAAIHSPNIAKDIDLKVTKEARQQIAIPGLFLYLDRLLQIQISIAR